jgi:hypothetical protein
MYMYVQYQISDIRRKFIVADYFVRREYYYHTVYSKL